jgi:phenylpyruvate tautomerase PptA (4-oxalocrotonate tautomerase family)
MRGVNVEEVRKISRELTDNLVKLIDCPREYIFLEVINTTSVFDGEIVATSPFVEVAWFEREISVQDAAAAEITRAVKSLGKPNVDVVFVTYKERNYYENGVHF